jgi:hypothetical protein
MREITADSAFVAYCGLYCGSCKKFLREACPGCHVYEKATWCRIRTCCKEHAYKSCADCSIVPNLRDCKKLNNFIAKVFAFIFRSDRFACLAAIKERGYEDYAGEMAEKRIMSIKRS